MKFTTVVTTLATFAFINTVMAVPNPDTQTTNPSGTNPDGSPRVPIINGNTNATPTHSAPPSVTCTATVLDTVSTNPAPSDCPIIREAKTALDETKRLCEAAKLRQAATKTVYEKANRANNTDDIAKAKKEDDNATAYVNATDVSLASATRVHECAIIVSNAEKACQEADNSGDAAKIEAAKNDKLAADTELEKAKAKAATNKTNADKLSVPSSASTDTVPSGNGTISSGTSASTGSNAASVQSASTKSSARSHTITSGHEIIAIIAVAASAGILII